MPREPHIEKLSDEFGDYLLVLTCADCGHVRRTPPHALARLCGWEMRLAALERRLRCSQCGRQRCTVRAVALAKPRGLKDPRS